MNPIDRMFAPILAFLSENDLSARTDRKGRTTFYHRSPKRHMKKVCTQPTDCPGLAVCGKRCLKERD